MQKLGCLCVLYCIEVIEPTLITCLCNLLSLLLNGVHYCNCQHLGTPPRLREQDAHTETWHYTLTYVQLLSRSSSNWQRSRNRDGFWALNKIEDDTSKGSLTHSTTRVGVCVVHRVCEWVCIPFSVFLWLSQSNTHMTCFLMTLYGFLWQKVCGPLCHSILQPDWQ